MTYKDEKTGKFARRSKKFMWFVVLTAAAIGVYKLGTLNSITEYKTQTQEVIVNELDAMTEQVKKEAEFQKMVSNLARKEAAERLNAKVEAELEKVRGELAGSF